MIICPRTVSCDLVSITAAELVSKHKKVVIDALDVPVEPAPLDLFRIVELCTLSNLLEHVRTNHRVVRIAHNFRAIVKLDCGVRARHTECVDKNVAWVCLERLKADSGVGDHLPQKRETRVILGVHRLGSL